VSLDDDPIETREWLESLSAVVDQVGTERARFLLDAVTQHGHHLGLLHAQQLYSAYRNTIPAATEAPHPGDVALEERLTAIMRWNALAMVVRANKAYGELGGHIASYASAAEIFEIGFNHFFRGPDAPQGGDLVFFQPHSAPGVYARAFLEGRLTEEQLARYRQEVGGRGLCSYPHPWLMPDFWQFPTGSMGIGPINAIYQARFMRYLAHRKLCETDQRHVWGVFGDGEMDEPESIAALTLAAREKLDNLTFIINCNLQRLDGPVRGNGQIIQELEALFLGAGWKVIKVLWGSNWDPLFARDVEHALLRRFATTVDGEYQTLGAHNGEFNLKYFFESDPTLKSLVGDWSPEQIDSLKRGGHDLRKLYAAFAEARRSKGRPTVILAKTKKGYGLGPSGESRMTTHQQKKLEREQLLYVRDRWKLPLSDEQVANLEFYHPSETSEEIQYLKARREALGGSLPARRARSRVTPVPPLAAYGNFALEAAEKEMSTTMAAVRLFTNLLKDKTVGPLLVPIVADEARTFGMAPLFRQIGIYAPQGQLYRPEDQDSLLVYREKADGQLLEEGITEAGALSSWVAAATAYSVHDLPLLPFYIFYSMFGFQRVGDLIWAAADQRARGFLIGATAGRTTLGGEGLQHQDGTSHVMAATVPNCRAYDPAFAGELAVIIDHAARQMLERREDVFYYITVMNENYPQPNLPASAHADVIKGMYRFSRAESPLEWATSESAKGSVHLLGSGAIFREVIAAAELLENDWQVKCELWSVTSFSELAREARELTRWNRLHPGTQPRASHVAELLRPGVPVIAATDYVAAYPQLIAPYIRNRFVALGTDGFGRSDARQALRHFFEVDRHHIVVAALMALADEGTLSHGPASEAIVKYGLNTEAVPPWN
jgi:pyruvate dehydrogenase E1 component